MSLVEYSKNELDLLQKKADEEGGSELQKMINSQIMEVIEIFSKQGHSETTADYAIQMIERLLRYKPIMPLTGDDDEWGTSANIEQNRRCFSVFRKPDGTAWDIDGIIVSDNGGITWFQSGRFRKQVTFPYYPPIHPERVYIEYKEDVPPGETGDEYEIITDNPERIRALRERMQKQFDEARA